MLHIPSMIVLSLGLVLGYILRGAFNDMGGFLAACRHPIATAELEYRKLVAGVKRDELALEADFHDLIERFGPKGTGTLNVVPPAAAPTVPVAVPVAAPVA